MSDLDVPAGHAGFTHRNILFAGDDDDCNDYCKRYGTQKGGGTRFRYAFYYRVCVCIICAELHTLRGAPNSVVRFVIASRENIRFIRDHIVQVYTFRADCDLHTLVYYRKNVADAVTVAQYVRFTNTHIVIV